MGGTLCFSCSGYGAVSGQLVLAQPLLRSYRQQDEQKASCNAKLFNKSNTTFGVSSKMGRANSEAIGHRSNSCTRAQHVPSLTANSSAQV